MAITHVVDYIVPMYRRVIGEKINLTTFNVGFESFIKARWKEKKKWIGGRRWPALRGACAAAGESR